MTQVFRALEYPAEVAKQEYHREILLAERDSLIKFVANTNSNGTTYDSLEQLLSDHLAIYEKVCMLYILYIFTEIFSTVNSVLV